MKGKIVEAIKYSKLLGLIDDRTYLKIVYRVKMGKKLNLKNPQTFNEKLQWLKLNDRKNIYTTMVDKYEAKKYVKNIIGEQYIISTIGVYDKFDDIDFDKLPKQFVMKCTHDSGGLVICKDKAKLNIEEAKKKINKCLKRNFYYLGREWPYKNVKPRIIIEKYMEDESGYQLKDYKIFCFDGVPKLIMVDSDRFADHSRNVYDEKWKKIDMNINFPSCDTEFEKPKCLKEMLEISKKLSEGTCFLRTDFYVINNKIYFGELTLFPGSGFQVITPISWQKKLGDLIVINEKKVGI